MKCEKPITEHQKELANKLYKLFYRSGWLTKEEMLEYLGWDSKKDRQLRDTISLVAKKVPIISTSDSKGYKLAKTMEDKQLVLHQWQELDSRIEELSKRRKPLIDFVEKFGGLI